MIVTFAESVESLAQTFFHGELQKAWQICKTMLDRLSRNHNRAKPFLRSLVALRVSMQSSRQGTPIEPTHHEAIIDDIPGTAHRDFAPISAISPDDIGSSSHQNHQQSTRSGTDSANLLSPSSDFAHTSAPGWTLADGYLDANGIDAFLTDWDRGFGDIMMSSMELNETRNS